MKNDTHIEQLAKKFAAIDNKMEMIDFLEGILTPKELVDISQRLQIIKMLKNGDTQRSIAKKLEVGTATVTRGSKELQKGRFSHV